MNAPLLSVSGMSVSFRSAAGRLQATRDVSFEVARGERIGIVGESGCGKTITGLSLMRLTPDDSVVIEGEICLRRGDNVIDLARAREKELRALRGSSLAMIFQEPMSALDPVFTVGAQISEGLRAHEKISKADARAKTLDLLRAVGIPAPEQRYDEYPHQLSGGMRQRVMIAGAIVCKPALLIADEPTTALDVTVQAQILDLLRRLSDDHEMAMLFITHDLGVVADICTRVLTMYAGEIIEDAPVDALLRRPLHPYASGLLQALPQTVARGAALPSIPGRVPGLHEMPKGCRFAARCAFREDACAAPQALAQAGDGRRVRCWKFATLHLRGVA